MYKRLFRILIPVVSIFALIVVPALAMRASAAGESVSIWVTTGDQSKLLQQQASLTFGSVSGSNPLTINVNPNVRYQTMDGYGASLTDSSAWLIYNSSARNTIMNDLFSKSSGIGLSMVRNPMGASDFSRSGNYNYDNTCCDLNDFSISHDNAYIIPLSIQARQINPSVKFILSPWSPPGWMKTSGSMIGGGLNHAVYSDMLAQYFVRTVQAYNAAGVPIYGITPQNEPLFSPAGYPGSLMSAGDQGQWIGYNLGPAMDAAGLGGVKIMAYDHNWDQSNYPLTVFGNSVANPYVDGVAWHCYGGNVSAQNTVHNAYPNKDAWLTECSGGNWAPYYNDFAANLKGMTENLIILNARYWGKGAILWNAALDPNNGPINGGCATCRGVVTVNGGSYTRTVDYYILGHASKFVDSGAYRIDSNTFGGSSIENVAFQNPDGSIVVVALNNASSSQTFRIVWNNQMVNYTLPAGAVATFKWMPGSTPPPTTPPPTTPASGCNTNVALNKPATSSSNENASYTPNLAVDGNGGTRWASAFSDPQWIRIDLGTNTSICRVRLNWEAAFGRSYQIQVSNDGTNWTNIYATTTGDGGVDDLTLTGTGRYVRMNGTVRATTYGYSLWDFDIFTTSGNPTPPPTTPPPTTPPPTTPPPGVYYRIDGRESGKSLDVSGVSTADGALVHQWAYGGALNQQWQFRAVSGTSYFQIVARHSGKCLDVSGVSTADGANIHQWTCGTGQNQHFQWQAVSGTSYFRIVARHSGKCLDVRDHSLADGGGIQQWTCGTGLNQQWSRVQVP